MAAGSLSNVGEPKFRTPEVVRIGNNPPPTTPPGMFVAPPPPDTTWLDLENREYSEFQISVDANFHITTIHANNGARFRLFIYRSTDAEIAIDINPWLDEVVKIPGTSVSKVYVLNVECYQVSGEEYLRYKVTNLIFDHQERKDKTWSSSKIKETINAVVNDEEVSLTGTWSSTKLKQAIDAKQDKIEGSLQVDEITRKSNAEIGGLTFLSKSTHKDWGDREDQWPSFQFISRVFDGYGNVVFESIPLYLNGAGVWEAFKLNAASLTMNHLRVATESFVNASIQNLSNLMSTDAERIAAINELTQSYNAADDQLQQTLTTALATKAGKAVNEEISGIYNFLNGLLVNGISLNDLFLGKSATAENSLKLGGLEAVYFLRRNTPELISGELTLTNYYFNRDVARSATFADKIKISGENAWMWRRNSNTDDLRLYSYGAGKDVMFFDYLTGNVGINKTSPSEKLEVAGNGIFDGNLSVTGQAHFNNARTILSQNTLGAYFQLKDSAGNINLTLRGYSYNNLNLPLKIGDGTVPSEALDVEGNIKASGTIQSYKNPGEYTSIQRYGIEVNCSAGYFTNTLTDGVLVLGTRGLANESIVNLYLSRSGVSVGKTGRATEALDVTGNIIATGTIQNGSDRRLKSNIQPLTPRGELNPVTFIKNGKPDLGFIAQEVKELYPELVAGEESEDTFLTLNYSQLTAVLYAELKELRAEVKHLKQLIQNDTNV